MRQWDWSAAVAVGSCVLALQAQAPQAPFRAGVEIVQLDVSVLDKNGQPIRGLPAKDFTLLDSGEPQKLSVFSAVDLPDYDKTAAAWTRARARRRPSAPSRRPIGST